MLIVNSKQLPANANKDSDMYMYVKEYQDCIADLKVKFPTGEIALKRNGYPKITKGFADDSMAKGMPEMPTPVIFKLTKTVNGVTWGYCKGRPIIQPNGLVEVPPNDNSETFSNLIERIDIRSNPDFAFFVMYKSNLIGSHFTIYDPEGDKIRKLTENNDKLKVQFAIREGMDEEKLRMVCQSMEIKDAAKKNILILQEELEKKVFAMEERKKKEPTNLMLKGVPEFLAEIKNDDVTRPKAIIQFGIDEGKITFNPKDSHFYFDSADICYVPITRQSDRQDYLAFFLHNPENEQKWKDILKGLITIEYIDSMDKYGARWLAKQCGIPLNKKPEELITALHAEFTQAE